jgi:hypothetical protein
MNILALKPGGNSLKVEFVQCRAEQRYAFEGRTLLSAGIALQKKMRLCFATIHAGEQLNFVLSIVHLASR